MSQPIADEAQRNRLKSMAILITLDSAVADAHVYAAFSPTHIGTADDGLKRAAPAENQDLKQTKNVRIADNKRGFLRYYLAAPCVEGSVVSASLTFHGHPSGRGTPPVSRRIAIEQTLVSCPGSGPALIPFGVELTRW